MVWRVAAMESCAVIPGPAERPEPGIHNHRLCGMGTAFISGIAVAMDSGLPLRGIRNDNRLQNTLPVDVDMEKVARPSRTTSV